MKVIKPDDLALLATVFPEAEADHDGCRLVLVCLACFPFASQPPGLHEESELWDCVRQELPLCTPVDECRPKPRGEFLVYGSCHAPADRGVTRARDVEVRVANHVKRITVFGERFWYGSRHGDPDPFVNVPVTWVNAFGGSQDRRNPLGKGHEPLEDGRRPLPAVESHGEYITCPEDTPEPAGLGAMAPSWLSRLRHAGSWDGHWLRERWPDLPEDVQPEYFMCAPEDQRLEGYFTGKEDFAVFGMHPQKDEVSGVLPAVRCRIFMLRRDAEQEAFEELETRADTLTLFPGKERGVLAWRGVSRTVDEECADIEALLALFEPAAEPPLPVGHYRELLQQALQPSQAPAQEGLKADPVPSQEEIQVQAETQQPPDVEAPELERMVAAIEQESRQILTRAGMSEEQVQAFSTKVERETMDMLPPDRLEAGAVSGESSKDPLAEMQSLVQELEARGREMLQRSGKSEEEIEAILHPAGGIQEPPDLESHFAPQLQDPNVPQNVKLQLRGMIDSFAEVATLCASLAQLGGQDAHKPQQETPQDTPPTEEQQTQEMPKQVALTREQVLERHARGESLAATDCSGLDLSGLDLRDAVFQGALLQNVNFAGADLRNADLSGADCSGSDCSDCLLQGALLSGALMEKTLLRQTKAQGMIARQTLFYGADAQNADFSEADLQDADFSGAVLNKAQLRKARAERIRLFAASLLQADCRGANLSNSRADKSTDATRARLDGTDMTLCAWHGACLQEADLQGTLLHKADMSGCVMRQAKLQCADASGARFYKTDLQRASLCRASLQEACLRRARLDHVDLELADMQGADLYRCTIQGARLHLARLENTLLDPALLLDNP